MAVERTVSGLGYELVDVERSAGGLLRVTIDRIPGRRYGPLVAAGQPEAGDSSQAVTEGVEGVSEGVTVDDCELVTRQLQRVLEVENVDYARLEVSSPGLDRPLRRVEDYRRFAGNKVALSLRAPLDGRKKFQGTLLARGDGWQLVLDPGQVPAPADGSPQALDFSLDEVREARLVPVLDFKGRRRAAPQRPAEAKDVAQDGD
jgi:ribosome maturation factor RimP